MLFARAVQWIFHFFDQRDYLLSHAMLLVVSTLGMSVSSAASFELSGIYFRVLRSFVCRFLNTEACVTLRDGTSSPRLGAAAIRPLTAGFKRMERGREGKSLRGASIMGDVGDFRAFSNQLGP